MRYREVGLLIYWIKGRWVVEKEMFGGKSSINHNKSNENDFSVEKQGGV